MTAARAGGRVGRNWRVTPGLAEILNAEGGPNHRQLEEWVKYGYLKPTVLEPGAPATDTTPRRRARWEWPWTEQKVAIAMGRLVGAGLRPSAAEKVARHPTGGPVVLGPGVIVSLFDLPASKAQRDAGPVVNPTCGICHQEPAENGGTECTSCREQGEYWDSLTPAERRAEDEAMSRYTEESREWS